MATAPPPLDLSAFVSLHGRLPQLGDKPAPWHYRGWLLFYIIQLHALLPAVGDRWGYYLRILEAGKLLAEPIPPITFGPADNKVFSLLRQWSQLIGYDCGGWSDFRSLLDWLGWALALSREEPRLSDAVNEKLYRQVDLTPLLETPHDYLGAYVAAGKANGWNPTAFYPTPHPVVECMVRLLMHDATKDDGDPRLRSACDPCAGSGRMLLHASNRQPLPLRARRRSPGRVDVQGQRRPVRPLAVVPLAGGDRRHAGRHLHPGAVRTRPAGGCAHLPCR